MTKHSPGPWKWEYASHLYGGDEPGERRVLTSPGGWVLSTHPDDDKIIVTPGDESLIAAAPEMLDLLRELIDEGPRLNPWLNLRDRVVALLARLSE